MLESAQAQPQLSAAELAAKAAREAALSNRNAVVEQRNDERTREQNAGLVEAAWKSEAMKTAEAQAADARDAALAKLNLDKAIAEAKANHKGTERVVTTVVKALEAAKASLTKMSEGAKKGATTESDKSEAATGKYREIQDKLMTATEQANKLRVLEAQLQIDARLMDIGDVNVKADKRDTRTGLQKMKFWDSWIKGEPGAAEKKAAADAAKKAEQYRMASKVFDITANAIGVAIKALSEVSGDVKKFMAEEVQKLEVASAVAGAQAEVAQEFSDVSNAQFGEAVSEKTKDAVVGGVQDVRGMNLGDNQAQVDRATTWGSGIQAKIEQAGNQTK